MIGLSWLWLSVASLGGPEAGTPAEFLPPVRLEADGKPIEVVGGHLHPFVGDVDGDGARDLLVGSFDGLVRAYRNLGSDSGPRLGSAAAVRGGAVDARVPTG